jgi:hypothetical protein
MSLSREGTATVRLHSILLFLCSFVPSFDAAQSSGLTRGVVRTQDRCYCLACCCCCLMKHPTGETSGTVHSAPPRVRACLHAWQQHRISARSAAQQQQAGRAKQFRQTPVVSLRSLTRSVDHHDDRERTYFPMRFFLFSRHTLKVCRAAWRLAWVCNK